MNVSNSCVVPRSNPSAMLFETETAAFSNWFRVPECPRKHGFAVNPNTPTASSIASFQTGNSSKRLYFTRAFSSAQRLPIGKRNQAEGFSLEFEISNLKFQI